MSVFTKSVNHLNSELDALRKVSVHILYAKNYGIFVFDYEII